MVYLVLDVRRSLRYYLEHGVPIFYDYDIFNIKEIFVLTCKLVTHNDKYHKYICKPCLSWQKCKSESDGAFTMKIAGYTIISGGLEFNALHIMSMNPEFYFIFLLSNFPTNL